MWSSKANEDGEGAQPEAKRAGSQGRRRHQVHAPGCAAQHCAQCHGGPQDDPDVPAAGPCVLAGDMHTARALSMVPLLMPRCRDSHVFHFFAQYNLGVANPKTGVHTATLHGPVLEALRQLPTYDGFQLFPKRIDAQFTASNLPTGFAVQLYSYLPGGGVQPWVPRVTHVADFTGQAQDLGVVVHPGTSSHAFSTVMEARLPDHPAGCEHPVLLHTAGLDLGKLGTQLDCTSHVQCAQGEDGTQMRSALEALVATVLPASTEEDGYYPLNAEAKTLCRARIEELQVQAQKEEFLMSLGTGPDDAPFVRFTPTHDFDVKRAVQDGSTVLCARPTLAITFRVTYQELPAPL